MRTVLIAASAMAALLAGEAGAQRMAAPEPGGMTSTTGAGYSAPGAPRVGTAMLPDGARGKRWGSNVGGRWWAGANAPGGWGAYRRPARGWTLPGYWAAPGFTIADWSTYGLGEPPAGYGWSRYYDDAVLVDGRGHVFDCVSNIDWNRGGYDGNYRGEYQGDDNVYAGPGDRGGYAPPPSPYAQTSPYAQQSPTRSDRPTRRPPAIPRRPMRSGAVAASAARWSARRPAGSRAT